MEFLSIWMQNSGPAETTNYYIAGYVIFFIVISLYLASFFVRNRNLKQEYALLKDLERDDN
ncbi:MAG: hypothetical protein ACK2T5_00115 [Anaerolineales bacterium]|jgi:hypothetical protein